MMVAVSLEFAAFPAVFPETSLVVALTTMVSPTIRIILRNEGGRDPCIAGIRCILVGEQKVVGPEFDHDPRVRLRGPQGINETRCCAGPRLLFLWRSHPVARIPN